MEDETGRYGTFHQAFMAMKREIHMNAVAHGWWEERRSGAECIALMHSELSEALEAMRVNPGISYRGMGGEQHVLQDVPDRLGLLPAVAVELADCIIRIMDYAAYAKLPLAEAIIEKHEFNKARPYRHGGKML